MFNTNPWQLISGIAQTVGWLYYMILTVIGWKVIVFLIILFCIYLFFSKKHRINKVFDIEHPTGYKKRTSLMNSSESALFFELQKQLPSNYHIFPNMRLADIVDAINGHSFYKRRNKILPKHIDFVICDSFFKPIVAIELNGNSHSRLDRIEKDEEKRKILEEAQLPLVIVRAGDNFNQAVLKIKSYL